MLDDIVGFIAHMAVKLIGKERCGRAIAEMEYGQLGQFAVFFMPPELEEEDDDDDDEDDPSPTGLDPDIWGGWADK